MRQYDLRQLLSLGTVMALTPALRLFPSQAAAGAGRAGWLAPLFALPLVFGWAWAISRLWEERRGDEQFPDLLLRLGGRRFGKCALAVFTLWTLVYAGFVLRSGSDRLVGTVYPGAPPALFTQLMGLLALMGALSSPRTLVRVGRMLLPAMLGVLLLLLGWALFSADADNLWPLGTEYLLPAVKTSIIPLDIAAGAGTALCFLAGGLRQRKPLFPALLRWGAGLCVLLSLLSAAVTGAFGAELTARLARPFFVLARTLVFFRSLERVEALIVMLWIFPDFLMTAVFLWAGQYSLRLLCGYRPDTERHPRLDLTQGRFMIWFAGAGVTAFALLLAPDPAALERWSVAVIPAANLGFVFGVLPLVYFIGKREALHAAEPRPPRPRLRGSFRFLP